MWILFFLFWAFAATVIYAYLKQQKQITGFEDVLWTAVLDGLLGIFITYAIANLKVNLSDWFVIAVGFVGNLLFSYKLFEKRK